MTTSFYIPQGGSMQVKSWATGGTVTFHAPIETTVSLTGYCIAQLVTPHGHHRHVPFQIKDNVPIPLQKGFNHIQIAPSGTQMYYADVSFKGTPTKMVQIPIVVNGHSHVFYGIQHDQTPQYHVPEHVPWVESRNQILFTPVLSTTCVQVQIPRTTGVVTVYNHEHKTVPISQLQQCTQELTILPFVEIPPENEYSDAMEIGGILLVVGGLAWALMSKKTWGKVAGIGMTLAGGTVAAVGYEDERKKSH